MKHAIFNTTASMAPLFTRLALGLVIFPHGAQKLLGWFGGYGFEGTMNYFTESQGLPWIIGFIVIIVEFFGSLALILGFAVRIWSIAIGSVMLGIILTVFNEYFFMNFFGNQKTEGMEFFILAIGMSLTLVVTGAGRYSIDKTLSKSGLSSISKDRISLASKNTGK